MYQAAASGLKLRLTMPQFLLNMSAPVPSSPLHHMLRTRTFLDKLSLLDAGADLVLVALTSTRHEGLVQPWAEVIESQRVFAAQVEELCCGQGRLASACLSTMEGQCLRRFCIYKTGYLPLYRFITCRRSS